MKSIRRLYFYLVTLISMEVVLWGLVGLLRSIVDETISGGADALAQALALILVGVPIFLIHWLWAQRAAAHEEDEKNASIRAVFLYTILLATLIPVAQNLLSFIDRSLVQVTGLGIARSFSAFREQTIPDNLIAMGMNLIVAVYFWNVLKSDWATLANKENFSDVRRLYRYIWMLYGLLLTVFGTQQVLRFLLYIPGDVLGDMGREVVVNGMALIVVGTPIWVYAWKIIQDALVDSAEMGSTLRLVILYLLSLGGVITIITAGWIVVNAFLNVIFGQDITLKQLIQNIGGPISIGVPLGLVWSYYGHWLKRHIEAVGDKVRQAGMKRLYNYILSFIGLIVSFVGVASLLSFIVDIITNFGMFFSDYRRVSLSTSISSLIVGLPLWLSMWRPMQAEALIQGEMGDHARRSILRKVYLYLVLFVSVIGGMATAVGLVYQLIRVVLNVEVYDFLNTVLNLIQLLFLCGVVLVYHLNVLRADGASTADSLAEKQSEYLVLVIDSGNGFVDAIKASLGKLGSKVQLTIASPEAKPDGTFHTLVLSGGLAVNAPEWIRSFNGNKVVVQNEAPDIVWVDDEIQAAQSVQKLAEGQEIQNQKTSRSPWLIVVYVFAALFALQMLFMLLAFGISLVTSF